MNGWYYDRQLNDPLTSISLHPNKELDKKTGEWVAIDGFDESGKKRGDGEQFRRDTVYVGQGYRPVISNRYCKVFRQYCPCYWF